METKVAVAQTWDDLVFENRNKEYGAYSVRKKYSDRVIYAVFISLSAMVMAILAPMLLALLKGEETPLQKVVKDLGEFTVTPKVFEVILPPKAQPQPRTQRVISPPHHDVVPVVTTQQVVDDIKPSEDTPVEFNEPVDAGTGTPGNGTPDTKAATGTDSNTIFCYTGSAAPEVMPHFIGGEPAMARFVQQTIHYPVSARRAEINGRVFVSFIIDREGIVKNAEVIKGLSADCDAEALRIVNMMPRWEPGRFNNLPVAVKMVLPIRFVVQ